MGAEARWVCHTCKTVCSRGGAPVIVRTQGDITVLQLDDIEGSVANLKALIDIGSDRYERWTGFVSDLKRWLSKHEGHNTHIGSDYTTDVMDLDDYRNESVDGKVSDATRLEQRTLGCKDWRKARVQAIKDTIMECKSTGAYGHLIDVDKAAETLYEHFVMAKAPQL